MSSKDPILKHVQLTEELWNERKGLDYCKQNKGEQKRTIKRMRKLIEQLRSLDLEAEMKLLEGLNRL